MTYLTSGVTSFQISNSRSGIQLLFSVSCFNIVFLMIKSLFFVAPISVYYIQHLKPSRNWQSWSQPVYHKINTEVYHNLSENNLSSVCPGSRVLQPSPTVQRDVSAMTYSCWGKHRWNLSLCVTASKAHCNSIKFIIYTCFSVSAIIVSVHNTALASSGGFSCDQTDLAPCNIIFQLLYCYKVPFQSLICTV
jgi:hypothetical protein